MSEPSKCPQCGTILRSNAPAGLCPNCLMALNLNTETVFTDNVTAAQSPLPPEQIAPHFPQLEILECLGRGGMGVVYKARQKTLDRMVALKILAPERVRDPQFAGRFEREAQALARLDHPHIVTVHDFGQAGGFYYLLMEFVDGVNLRQLLRAGKLTPEEALAIVPPLCEALQFAHDRGIIHRDIKPENLLLDKNGQIKIADFGIAKMVGEPAGVASESGASAADSFTHQAAGTPGYMAPEQKNTPQQVDSRADIYSLGVVFYEMLTGELPKEKIEPPSSRMRGMRIDVRLDELVLRALEKSPELRWQTAVDLRTQVETISAVPGDARDAHAAPPRISRTAIVGMIGPALFALFAVMLFGAPGQTGGMTLSPMTLTAISVIALLGMCVLGCTAVLQIRRSSGSIYGLPLAFGEVILGPLLAADAVIFFVCDMVAAAVHGDWDLTNRNLAVFYASATVLSLIVDFLIIRRIWRAVNRPTNGASVDIPLRTGSADVSSAMPVAAIPLNKQRLEVVILGFVLAVACVEMGINITPVEYGWVIGIWGVLLFMVSAPLALLAGDNFGKIKLAAQVVLVDGIAVALAGIWCAWHTPMLPVQWSTVIILALLCGIAHCLRSLAKWAREETQTKVHALPEPRFSRTAITVAFGSLILGILGVMALIREFPGSAAQANIHYQAFVIDEESANSFNLPMLAVSEGSNWLRADLSPDVLAQLRDRANPEDDSRIERRRLIAWWPKVADTWILSGRNFSAAAGGFLGIRKRQEKLEGRIEYRVSGSVGETPYQTSLLYEGFLQASSITTFFFPLPPQNGRKQFLVLGFDLVNNPPGVEIRDKLAQQSVHSGPPFVARLEQGTVELLALAQHPSSNAPSWHPDGSPSKEPFPSAGGSSSSAGNIMKEIAFRVRSRAGTPSEPVLRIDPESGVRGMGGSVNWDDKNQTALTYVRPISCPPGARQMSLKVGVAEGDWQTVFPLNMPTASSAMTSRETSDTEGMWKAYTEATEGRGGDVALAFHYSASDDFETRMVCVKTDGTVSPLQGHGSQGAGGLINSITTMSAGEYSQIKEFQLQKRRYQWVEFHNVSLEFGHKTSVETVNAPGLSGSAAGTTANNPQLLIEKKLLHAIEKHLLGNGASTEDGEFIGYKSLIVDVVPDLSSAKIEIGEPQPRGNSPHKEIWKSVRKGSFVAGNEGNGLWIVTGLNDLGALQFKVHVTDEAEPAPPAVIPAPRGKQALEATFGPVVERVLPLGEPAGAPVGPQYYFQFRSGTAVADSASNWNSQKIDFSATQDADEETIWLIGMRCVFTNDVRKDLKWDVFTAGEAVNVINLSGIGFGTVGPLKKNLPATYLFKTAHGEIGLMQVLGIVEDERGYHGHDNKGHGVKFRYKLVQGATSAQLSATPAFGPVIERVVKNAADLDTGRLANELPESVKDKTSIAEAVLDTVGWMEKEGMDVFADSRTHFFGVGMRAIAQDKDAWEQLTSSKVVAVLDASITKVSTYVPLEPLDGTATYVIQTREGCKGLLQILGSDNDGVKIRYKLVQN